MRTGTLLSVLAGAAILGACAAGALALRGTGDGAVRGVLLGAGVGASGTVLEALLMARALALPKGDALLVVLGGFGVRLVVLVAASLALHATGFADPIAFALSFVGGFLAGTPLVASAARGRTVPPEAAR